MRPTIAGDSYGQIEQLMAARDAAAASNYFNSLNSWQRNNQMQLEQAGNEQRNRVYWAQLQQAKEQADRVDQMRQIQFATENANANRSYDFSVGQAKIANEQGAERLRLEDFRYRHPQGESDSRITSAIATDIDNGVRPDVAVATWGSTLEASPWAITRFNAKAEESKSKLVQSMSFANELNAQLDAKNKYDLTPMSDRHLLAASNLAADNFIKANAGKWIGAGWVIRGDDGRYAPNPTLKAWEKFTLDNTVATPAPDPGVNPADFIGPPAPGGYDGSQPWPFSGSTAPVTQPAQQYLGWNAYLNVPRPQSQTPGTEMSFAQREPVVQPAPIAPPARPAPPPPTPMPVPVAAPKPPWFSPETRDAMTGGPMRRALGSYIGQTPVGKMFTDHIATTTTTNAPASRPVVSSNRSLAILEMKRLVAEGFSVKEAAAQAVKLYPY